MALRVFLLNAAGAIASSTLFATGVVDASAIANNAVNADKVDQSDDYNFSGALQVDGVDVKTTDSSLYYAVVRAATTGNVSNLATGAPNSVDGYTPSTNDDILVWLQSSAPTNGIYNVDTVGTGSNGHWTRAVDRDTVGELPAGLLVYVQGGTLHAQKLIKLTSSPAVLGTNDAIFEEHQEGMTPIGGGEPEFLGVGDGSTLTFDLAESGVIYSVVLVDGVEQAGNVYSISAGTGSGGVDQLVFTSGNAPASGAGIEVIGFTRA